VKVKSFGLLWLDKKTS